jgi:hypothetical protein
MPEVTQLDPQQALIQGQAADDKKYRDEIKALMEKISLTNKGDVNTGKQNAEIFEEMLEKVKEGLYDEDEKRRTEAEKDGQEFLEAIRDMHVDLGKDQSKLIDKFDKTFKEAHKATTALGIIGEHLVGVANPSRALGTFKDFISATFEANPISRVISKFYDDYKEAREEAKENLEIKEQAEEEAKQAKEAAEKAEAAQNTHIEVVKATNTHIQSLHTESIKQTDILTKLVDNFKGKDKDKVEDQSIDLQKQMVTGIDAISDKTSTAIEQNDKILNVEVKQSAEAEKHQLQSNGTTIAPILGGVIGKKDSPSSFLKNLLMGNSTVQNLKSNWLLISSFITNLALIPKKLIGMVKSITKGLFSLPGKLFRGAGRLFNRTDRFLNGPRKDMLGRKLGDGVKATEVPSAAVSEGEKLGQEVGKEAAKGETFISKFLSRFKGPMESISKFFAESSGAIEFGAKAAEKFLPAVLAGAAAFTGIPELILLVDSAVTAATDAFEGYTHASEILGKQKVTFRDKVSASIGGLVGGALSLIDGVASLFGQKTNVGPWVTKHIAQTSDYIFTVFENMIKSFVGKILDILPSSMVPASLQKWAGEKETPDALPPPDKNPNFDPKSNPDPVDQTQAAFTRPNAARNRARYAYQPSDRRDSSNVMEKTKANNEAAAKNVQNNKDKTTAATLINANKTNINNSTNNTIIQPLSPRNDSITDRSGFYMTP